MKKDKFENDFLAGMIAAGVSHYVLNIIINEYKKINGSDTDFFEDIELCRLYEEMKENEEKENYEKCAEIKHQIDSLIKKTKKTK